MSGRGKRILAFVFSAAMLLAAAAGACLLLYFYAHEPVDYALFAVAMACEIVGVPVLFHEAGHLLFGLSSGLRPVSFSFGWITVGRGGVRFGKGQGAGETRMLPKKSKHVRAKLAFFSLGGAVSDLLIGALLLLIFFLLPFHGALLFFAELAPFFLAEGLCALFPAELPAGPTDGAFLLGLLKKSPETEVALRVMTVQGMLYGSLYTEIPRELLFDTPVVREDLPAFLALSELRWQFLLAAGEEEEARRAFLRFSELTPYLHEDALRSVAADMALAARAEGWELREDVAALAQDAAGDAVKKEPMRGLAAFRDLLRRRAEVRMRDGGAPPEKEKE